jgi:arsenical pump membrane protein
LALAIAAAAMLLLALRPWRIPGWYWPVGGSLLLVLVGIEPLRGAIDAIAHQWNVLLFILGLMGISVAAEEGGAFALIADLVANRARGSQRRLFIMLFLACAVVTILLSNDATAIALTPIAYEAVANRGGNPKPFLMACVFVANVASFGLPFSNPANVLILPHARLLPYLWHLAPAQVAAVAVTLVVFLFFFRRELKGRFVAATRIRQPPSRIPGTLGALAAVVVAYVAALLLRWPLGPVALGGAVLTLMLSGTGPLRASARVSWKTLALLAGLFVLLDALARAGYVGFALAELERAVRYGDLLVTAVAACGAAVLSNVFNNLPVAVASSYLVAHLRSDQIAYPLIVGVDAGPNLLTTGSLATILWLSVVRERGLRVSLLDYARLGALVVPSTIAVSVLWLWLSFLSGR